MSRMATSEYIGAKRRAYAQADRAKRSRILDEVCETTGYGRKYANRLLTGNRKFRERKGRGKTYGDDVAEVLKRVWREAGCPCLPYFKAEVGRWAEEYSTQVAHIRPDIKAQLLAMSDRTMSRRLSGEARVKPGWARGNKRSGRGARNEVKANTPCAFRPRRRRPFGQLLLDPRRHGPEDAVDRPLPDVEQGPARDAGGAQAHRRQVPVRHPLPAFRQRRRDAEQPCRGLSGKQDEEAVPVAIQAQAQQRQRPCRGEEQVVGAAALRGDQARLPLAAGRARQALRRLVGLAKLLLPVQDASVEGEAPGRQGLQVHIRQTKNPVPEGARRTRAHAWAGSRSEGVQVPPQRNGALQARAQAPPQDTAHPGGIRQGQTRRRRPLSLRGSSSLGASRHPFGDGGTSPRRDAPRHQQPALEPRRGTKVECPVFGKPETTKLLTECLFYLTNWDFLPPQAGLIKQV